jgi:endo-1,4-beta-mannosidase
MIARWKSVWGGILGFVVITGVFLPFTEYWGVTRPDPVFEWNGSPFYPVGLNWFPRDHPWAGTWTEYNGTEVTEDLLRIKALGGNCIRTFIQWYLVEPVPDIYNTTILNRIVDFFQRCSAANIPVMFCFFDFGAPSWAGLNETTQDEMYRRPDLVAREIRQLQTIIPLVNSTSAAWMWDLRNEPASTRLSQTEIRAWVANLTSAIRALGDSHLIVVGGGVGTFEDPAGYADLVDAVCCHYYGNRHNPMWKRQFMQYLNMFRASGKPVILQEFGLPSYVEEGYTEAMQAEDYRVIFEVCDKMNVAGIMPWTLWEFTPPLVVARENWFGILRPDGSWKPAAEVFHAYATGATVRSGQIYQEEF